jgi:hypothetical protein
MRSSRTSAKPANAKTATKLLVAMTGKASPAKAAEGDEPVFAYIASLPQPQRGIAECIDALAAKELPDLHRAVKWGMAYSGVGGGWSFSSGAFVGHVKLMFIRGTELEPELLVTPVGMGRSTRGVELASVDDLDELLVASWMRQAAAMPFFGGKLHWRAVEQASLPSDPTVKPESAIRAGRIDGQTDSQAHRRRWTSTDSHGLDAPADSAGWTSMDKPGRLAEDS